MGTFGVWLLGESYNNTFFNNTFRGNGFAVYDVAVEYSYSTTYLPNIGSLFYWNTFEDSSYDVYKSAPPAYLAPQYFAQNASDFNTSINGVNVGNSWDYICDQSLQFTDSDGNGYYDSGSDYPYNLTLYHSYSPGVDYYPKAVACSSNAVYLGGASSGESTAASGSSAAPAEAATISAPAAASETVSSLASSSSGIYFKNEKNVPVKAELSYAEISTSPLGDDLRKRGLDEEEIARIVLGDDQGLSSVLGKGYSLFGKTGAGKLSGIYPTGKLASGRLLQRILPQNEEMEIPPGGTFERTFEVESGLLVKPKRFQVKFTVEGEELAEEEIVVKPKSVIGSAVDVDMERQTIDIYLAVPIVEENVAEAEEYHLEFSVQAGELSSAPSALDITGAAVGVPDKISGSTLYSDLYGPFFVDRNEGVLFGQEFLYDADNYQGQLVMVTRILRGDAVISEHTFPVDFGGVQQQSSWHWLILAIVLLGIVLPIVIISVQSKRMFRRHPPSSTRKDVLTEQPLLPQPPSLEKNLSQAQPERKEGMCIIEGISTLGGYTHTKEGKPTLPLPPPAGAMTTKPAVQQIPPATFSKEDIYLQNSLAYVENALQALEGELSSGKEPLPSKNRKSR